MPPVNLPNGAVPLSGGDGRVCSVLVPVCGACNNAGNRSGRDGALVRLLNGGRRSSNPCRRCGAENVIETPRKSLTCEKCRKSVGSVLSKKENLTLIKALTGSSYKVGWDFELDPLKVPLLRGKRNASGTQEYVHSPDTCKPPKRPRSLVVVPQRFTF